MRFEFATATRIIFGPGTVSEVPSISAGMGKRACIVTGRSVERAQFLIEQLQKQNIECTTFAMPNEPTTTLAKEGAEAARKVQSEFVISIGGGSVLDTGKAIAAMLTNKGKLEEYLEVVGHGKPLINNAAPHITIPTTAGTGAEVTRNSVLGVPEHKVKVSIRSPLLLPTLAVVDSILTHSMTPFVTAFTGLDALTQLIEAFVSKKSNPLTNSICREGITTAGRSLQRAYENGSDANARENMSLASLFGGLALANAGLGAVHGFAGPLGGMISSPHGAICARLLPFVMETNVRALLGRESGSAVLSRYDEVAQLLTGQTTARASDGVKWVQDLCATLKVPSLTEFGLAEREFPAVIVKAQKSSSMKGNPIKLTDDELLAILRDACSQTE